MASVFPSLSAAMGSEDEQQKNQNIFGADSNPDAVATQTGAGGAANGAISKGTVEGQVDTANGSTGAASTSSPQNVEVNEGDRIAVKSSIGKVKAPSLIENTQNRISQQDQTLQNEADAYVSGAKAKNFDIDQGTIEKGLGGDAGALTSVKSTLGRKVADPYEGFKTTADTTLGDVDRLQNDAGLKDVLRREGGEDYTAGMGAFDLASLKRTPGFSQLSSALVGQRSALKNKADTYAKDKTAAAQAAVQANLEASQGKVRDYLGSQRSALESANAEEARRANEGRLARADAQRGGENAKAIAALKAQSPEMAQYFDEDLGVDANQYQKGEGEYNAADMYDQAEAARFERLASALGLGETRLAGRGQGGPGFDLAGYQGALLSKAQLRKGADDKATDDRNRAAALAEAERSRLAQEQADRDADEERARKARDPTMDDTGDNFRKAGVDTRQQDPTGSTHTVADNYREAVPEFVQHPVTDTVAEGKRFYKRLGGR